MKLNLRVPEYWSPVREWRACFCREQRRESSAVALLLGWACLLSTLLRFRFCLESLVRRHREWDRSCSQWQTSAVLACPGWWDTLPTVLAFLEYPWRAHPSPAPQHSPSLSRTSNRPTPHHQC